MVSLVFFANLSSLSAWESRDAGQISPAVLFLKSSLHPQYALVPHSVMLSVLSVGIPA